MKNYLIIALSVLIVILFCVNSCEKKPVTIINNSHLFKKVDSLELEYTTLKANSEQWQKAYDKLKDKKDSVKTVIKTKYITVFDTISQDTVECLPKPYVESLEQSFEYMLESSDSLIVAKNNQIENLEARIELKDTIIENYQINEKVLTKEVKKQKRKKWLFGVGGFGLGYLFGKSF